MIIRYANIIWCIHMMTIFDYVLLPTTILFSFSRGNAQDNFRLWTTLLPPPPTILFSFSCGNTQDNFRLWTTLLPPPPILFSFSCGNTQDNFRLWTTLPPPPSYFLFPVGMHRTILDYGPHSSPPPHFIFPLGMLDCR